jgi:type IV secretory pathway VirB6-like protein
MSQNFDDFMRRFEEIPPEPQPPTIPRPPEKRESPVKLYSVLDLMEMGWQGLVVFMQVLYAILVYGIILFVVVVAIWSWLFP